MPVQTAILRRNFLGLAAGAAVCAGLAGCKTLNPHARLIDAVPVTNGRAALGAAADLPVGGQLRVRPQGLADAVLVARVDEDRYEAVSITCTHFGSEVALTDDRSRFQCTNHGARFDFDGAVTRGPATNPLRAYEVVREEGQLYLVVS